MTIAIAPMAQKMATRSWCGDGERDVGADARQGDGRVADADGLGCDHEEPEPDIDIIMFQISDGIAEGHLDAPEARPGREAEHASGLLSSTGTVRSDW